MAIVSYDEICLADKSTVHKLVVIDILSYQIQIEIRVFAKNVPRTGNNLHKHIGSYRK